MSEKETEAGRRGDIGIVGPLTELTGLVRLAVGEQRGSLGRRRYAARFIRAGRIKARGDQPGRFSVPADAIAQAVAYGQFDAKPCFLDHAGWFQPPSLRDLAGVTLEGATFDPIDGAADGTLQLYDSSAGRAMGELFDTLLEDAAAGRPVPDVGLSLVFWPRWKEPAEAGEPLEVAEILHVDSIDLVFAPAADGRVRRALSIFHESQGEDQMGIEAAKSVELSSAQGAEGMTAENRQSIGNPTDPVGQHVAQGAEIWAPAVLASSGLPEAARQRLEERPYATPQELESAIQSERRYLAALAEDQVVQIGGSPPRGSGIALGQTPLELVQGAWDWVFGVADAPLPPPDLRRTERLYYLLTGDGAWTGVFQGAEALAAANPSTLPALAVNAMNKVIVPLYASLSHYRWYEQIVTVQPTDGTLHDMQWIQMGGIGSLPQVADGAAYTELSVADSLESSSFIKHGGYVGITDKMLRNSEIARLQAIPRALTVAAIRTRSAAIASIFTANAGAGPTLTQDSTALFHANHGNLATTAYSWDAWKAARLDCAKQGELGSGSRSMLFPRFWLGPADLYDTALIDFGYGAGAGGRPGTPNNDLNPYAQDRPGDPRPIPVAVPEFVDTNDWAYLADPALAPVIQMAYADSPGGRAHPAPLLFTVASPLAGLMFTNDVMPIKVRDQWAYGVATYRGIGKRNVA